MSDQNGNQRSSITKEMLEKASQKTEYIVEVNLSNALAKVVDTSDAPSLTEDILQTFRPIRDGVIVFEGKKTVIGVFHGVPTVVENKRLRIIAEYKEREMTDNLRTELDRRIKELMVANMIADPVFSYEGEPADGYPVENLSAPLLNAFYEEYHTINDAVIDVIYQVKVRRDITSEVREALFKAQEQYPLTNIDDEALLKNGKALADAQRAIQICGMLLDPVIVLDVEGEGYPIAEISEQLIQSLYNSVAVVHDSKEALRQLTILNTLKEGRERILSAEKQTSTAEAKAD